MKSYRDCTLKRTIQYALWDSESKHKTILGLSSPEVVQDYISVLPKYENLILVNYEPIDEAINCNSLIGMFDILLHKNLIPTFIDADFCNSIKNSGDDLIYLYNKCKRLNRDITISFTFSIRGVGVKKTLVWLLQNFKEFKIYKPKKYVGKLPNKRQFLYYYGDTCFHYRESGDQMITGVIKISKTV